MNKERDLKGPDLRSMGRRGCSTATLDPLLQVMHGVLQKKFLIVMLSCNKLLFHAELIIDKPYCEWSFGANEIHYLIYTCCYNTMQI